MNILLTIAARGGSKGVKNKNIRTLCGTPLIEISIRQALQWGKARDIVVTTDSAEIAEVAKKAGAQVPFLRPADMASDTAAKVPALRHALLEMERKNSLQYDLVVDLDPTAPVRSVQDIEGCFKLFLEKKPKTIFSAVVSHKSPYFNMVEVNTGGFAELCKRPPASVVRRQDAPVVYALNASIYVYDRNYLADVNNNSVISDQSIVYPMADMSAFDIDREVDFKFIEFLVKEGLVCI